MSMKLPMAVLDQCVGHKIWIVMKGKREFSGILRGFDDYFNAVLEDVLQKWLENDQKSVRHHESILLNGHDIAYVFELLFQLVPGSDPLRKQIEGKRADDVKK